jgi:hypothetical protein
MPEPLAQLQAAHHLRHVSVNVTTHTEKLLFHPYVQSAAMCRLTYTSDKKTRKNMVHPSNVPVWTSGDLKKIRDQILFPM